MVEPSERADFYILNTCSVTEFADKKCRKFIRQSKRLNPMADVIIIGCYAQLQPEEISNLNGVTKVLSAAEKFELPNILQQLQKGTELPVYQPCEIESVNQFFHSSSQEDRTRAFLKVQDGCDYSCTFCTIPLARGKSRSPKIAEILERGSALIAQGFKEIVLTGVNTGDFGKRLYEAQEEKENLYQLLKAFIQLPGLARLRVSSIEPNLLSEEIIALFAEDNPLMPHFHIPLQSGSDEVLKKMKRRYLSDLYANRVSIIKKLIPDACIGVDVIVGFPTETDEAFLESYEFVKSLDISYLHVFTYSSRPNTEAEKLEQQAMNIRRKRNEIMRNLSKEKQLHFINSQLGKKRSCLFEAKLVEGKRFGYTDNYIRIQGDASTYEENQLVEISIGEVNKNGTFATPIAHSKIIQEENINA